MFKKNVYLDIFSHIPKYKKVQLGILILLMLITAFVELLSIGSIYPFIASLTSENINSGNKIISNLALILSIKNHNELIFILGILFAITALFSGLMRSILLYFQTQYSYSLGADFSISIYRKSLFQPYSVHISQNSSEVIAGINTKASSLVSGAIYPSLTILSSAIIIFAILAALFSFDIVAGFILVFSFSGIYYLIARFTKKVLKNASQSINIESGFVIKALQEGLGGIRDVILDGSQEAYVKIYRNSKTALQNSSAKVQIMGGLPRYLVEALGMVLLASIVSYSAINSSGGVTDFLPFLATIAMGIQRLLPAVQQLYLGVTQIRGGQHSVAAALELLNQPTLLESTQISRRQSRFNKSIFLEKVSYRYNERAPWILEKISVEISKGLSIGIIGKTGCGKSTLLDILMGLLEPSLGAIYVDGVLIDSKNMGNLRALISHVPQSIFLTDSSVGENIAFGVPFEEINWERVAYAAVAAQISEEIKIWPDQYLTLVGERGVKLSGGQRQRIGIARAIYKNTPILVLDEATSALDSLTEEAVIKSLRENAENLTIVMVAHRVSTLRYCDQVIEISNKKINKIGTYSEVILNE